MVQPLLAHATNLRGPESEVLVEEAFKLWSAVLSSSFTVPPPMLALLPSMSQILRRGKDNSAAFQILEGYFVLGAGGALQPYGPAIAAALAASVEGLHRDIVAGLSRQQGVRCFFAASLSRARIVCPGRARLAPRPLPPPIPDHECSHIL